MIEYKIPPESGLKSSTPYTYQTAHENSLILNEPVVLSNIFLLGLGFRYWVVRRA